MRISLFADLSAADPEIQELDFQDLPELLRALEHPDKMSAPCWIAGPTAGRTDAHVEQIECLVLDYDKTEPEWDKLATWTYVAHTTHSHRPEAPCWRVIVELCEPAPAATWKARYKAKLAMHALAANTDPKCCNPARIWFVPPPGAEWRVNLGAFGASMPDAAQTAEPVAPAREIVDHLENDGSAFWPQVVRDMQMIPPSVEGQGGDDRLYEAAIMVRKGYRLTPAKCFEALQIFNARCRPPWDEARLWYKIDQAPTDTQTEAGSLIPVPVKAALDREAPDAWVPQLHAALARYLRPAGLPVPMEWDAILEPLPPVEWLCRALGIAPGRPTVVSGASGSGKTLGAQELALAVASGQPVFGSPFHRVRKGSVLHVDIDQGSAATRRRYQQLKGSRDGLDLSLVSFGLHLTRTNEKGGVEIDLDALFRLAVLAKGKALVIIDSLRGLARGLEENSSSFGEVLECLTAAGSALQEVTGETPPVFLVIHHSGKPQPGKQTSLRGSSAIRDRAGCVWVLERVEGAKESIWHQDKVSEATVRGSKDITTVLEEGPLDAQDEPQTVAIRLSARPPGEGKALSPGARTKAAIIRTRLEGEARWFTREDLGMKGNGSDISDAFDSLEAAGEIIHDRREPRSGVGRPKSYFAATKHGLTPRKS